MEIYGDHYSAYYKHTLYMCMHACSAMSDSLVTPWTVAQQAPLSMGFSRQERWTGLPSPPPRDLPDPGIKPTSPALVGGFLTTELPGNTLYTSVNKRKGPT